METAAEITEKFILSLREQAEKEFARPIAERSFRPLFKEIEEGSLVILGIPEEDPAVIVDLNQYRAIVGRVAATLPLWYGYQIILLAAEEIENIKKRKA